MPKANNAGIGMMHEHKKAASTAMEVSRTLTPTRFRHSPSRSCCVGAVETG